MQKRKRGVTLTPQGLKKFQSIRRRVESEENSSKQFTLEELSQRTNLDPLTIRKILNVSRGVDRRTLKALFSAFDLELSEEHYSTTNFNKQQDLRGIANIAEFYGRKQELNTLNDWLVKDCCRLVTILGMGGVGKTSLSVKLVELMQSSFDCVIWRSLHDAPPLDMFLSSIFQFLSDGQETEGDLLESTSEKILRLVKHFRELRCLMVFDNIDAALQGGSRAGKYRSGYENYGELFKQIGESDHQSCLLLITREKPKEVALLEGETSPVRTLRLGGLKEGEGEEMLKSRGLKGTEADFNLLVRRYSGNGLALKIVASSIKDLFNGYVSRFLQQETTIFGEVRDLLEQQFERLSDLEKNLMYWLAINQEPVTLSELQEDLVSLSQLNLLETLESLKWRSLIEQDAACFTLQPIVMEYVINCFIENLCEELNRGEFVLLYSHALVKTTAKEHIREAQIRLILTPTLDKLLLKFQGKRNLEYYLAQVLVMQREHAPLRPGYLGGNVLNLLIQMGVDLTGYDFSYLIIRQADLQCVNLQNTNSAHASFDR